MIWQLSAFLLIAIIALGILRRRLLFELSALFLLLIKKSKPGLWFYAFIMFPGTLLHELSHWLMAEILQVRTGEIRLFPELQVTGESKLGSVATARVGLLRSILIGIAPFVVGILVLLLLGHTLDLLWPHSPLWQIALTAYGLVVVGSSMFLSSADLSAWPALVVLIIIVGLFIYFTGITFTPLYSTLILVTRVLWMTVGITFAMILLLYLLRKLLEIVVKRRVV